MGNFKFKCDYDSLATAFGDNEYKYFFKELIIDSYRISIYILKKTCAGYMCSDITTYAYKIMKSAYNDAIDKLESYVQKIKKNGNIILSKDDIIKALERYRLNMGIDKICIIAYKKQFAKLYSLFRDDKDTNNCVAYVHYNKKLANKILILPQECCFKVLTKNEFELDKKSRRVYGKYRVIFNPMKIAWYEVTEND